MRIRFVFKANANREIVQAECNQHFQYIYGVNSVTVAAEKRTGADVQTFQVSVDIEEGRHSALDQLKNAIDGYGGNIMDLVWVT